MKHNNCQTFSQLIAKDAASGSSLSQQELWFMENHRQYCEHCLVESNLLRHMQGLQETSIQPHPAPKTNEILLQVQKTNWDPSAKGRQRRFPVPIAYAAVAVILVGLMAGLFLHSKHAKNNPSQSVSPANEIVAIYQIDYSNKYKPQKMPPWQQGRQLETADGDILIHFKDNSKINLHQNAKFTIKESSKKRTTVRLTEGLGIFHISPQKKEHQFSVNTPFGDIEVVGTVFSVRSHKEGMEIQVAKGKVVYTNGATKHFSILAGQSYCSKHGLHTISNTTIERLVTQPQYSFHLTSLCPEINTKRILSTDTNSADTDNASHIPDLSNLKRPPNQLAQFQTKNVKTNPKNKLKESETQKASIQDLISRIRQARKNRNWSKAVVTYETLIRLYPNSKEARTCLVPMGQILLEYQNKPQKALSLFKRYLKLKGEGSLSEDALFGVISAHRTMGQTEKEHRAGILFLKKYPNSHYSPSVTTRLKAIDNAQ